MFNKKFLVIIFFIFFSLIIGVSNAFENNLSQNDFIDFSKSKILLEKYIYTNNSGGLATVDFYCGCKYDKKTKKIDLKSCGYENIIKGYKDRGKKIEWEHIVPAENFGRGFKEWREGDENKCIDKKGRKYKGRQCAQKNQDFNRMEGDMYNLYPVVGEINAIRGNLDYYIFSSGSVINKKKVYEYKGCGYKVDTENNIVEPKDDIKGDIARTYFYFEKKYPKYFKISDKNRKIYNIWNNLDKPSIEECNRYKKIKKIFKEENDILKEVCK